MNLNQLYKEYCQMKRDEDNLLHRQKRFIVRKMVKNIVKITRMGAVDKAMFELFGEII